MPQSESDFWNKHSTQYLEMAFNDDYRERFANPDGYGKETSDCGDTIEIFFMENNGKLETVSFQTEGCINTDACASSIVQMARGKSISEAMKITPERIVEYLETLPKESAHCSELAVEALHQALTGFQEKQVLANIR